MLFVTKIYVNSDPNFMFGLSRFLPLQRESGKNKKCFRKKFGKVVKFASKIVCEPFLNFERLITNCISAVTTFARGSWADETDDMKILLYLRLK